MTLWTSSEGENQDELEGEGGAEPEIQEMEPIIQHIVAVKPNKLQIVEKALKEDFKPMLLEPLPLLQPIEPSFSKLVCGKRWRRKFYCSLLLLVLCQNRGENGPCL